MYKLKDFKSNPNGSNVGVAPLSQDAATSIEVFSYFKLSSKSNNDVVSDDKFLSLYVISSLISPFLSFIITSGGVSYIVLFSTIADIAL